MPVTLETAHSSDTAAAARRRHMIGLLMILVAAVLWSTSGALVKLTFDGGKGPDGVTIAFLRSLIAGVFLLPLARGRWHTLSRKPDASRPAADPPKASLRHSAFAIPHFLLRLRPAAITCVICFTIMTAAFVLANTKTKAANVIILQYTSTFWVFLLSPRFAGERPRTEDRWILAVAMVGIAVIFAGNMATDLAALVIALASGFFYALLTLMIRIMRDSDSAAVTVFNNLGSAVLLLPLVLLVGGWPTGTRYWVLLVLLGVAQFGLPYYLYSLGLVRVPAYQAALVTMAEPILNPLWAYIAVRDPVPPTTLVGGGIVLAALLLFIRAARRVRI